MVSIALCSEMETEPCCEEVISEPSDRDSVIEVPCGPAEEGRGPCVKELAETESCTGEGESTEIKSHSDPERESREEECKEGRKLKKTNSWKMVRFQDPSTEDDKLERDSSAKSLFPEYATEEWTSTSFKELFIAEDWKHITGEDRNST